MADALNRAGDSGESAGGDTEFYGWSWPDGPAFDYDPSAISPIGRTRVHVWSVAVLTDRLTPRGYRAGHGAVLPESALSFRPLRDWLESDSPKCFHNLAADDHTLWNHGIRLGGGRDTLSVARWCWPDRASLPPSRKPFGLKTLASELLGYDVTVTFEDFMEPNIVEVHSERSQCVCGIEGCRKRKAPHGQYKAERVELVERGKKPYPLYKLEPGHPLWEKYVRYAAQDAIWAVELNDLAMRQTKELDLEWHA